ncbi:MAG: ParB N-terminal domain-containing protein [Selenomonadaceae bacterium]|nr:ParB N-terminal domain-containing protein [Selenomonadaceae bacterium]
MQIVERSVAELVPYENNPRKNEPAVEKVAASSKAFGFKVPIIVDKDNVIVAGHTRLLAAKELGFEKVPCIIADDLTEAQIRAFRLADNKVSEFSGWDFDKLDEELAGIQCMDLDRNIDMEAFGFDGMTAIGADDDPDGGLNDFFEAAPDTPESGTTQEPKKKTVTCPHCGETFEV